MTYQKDESDDGDDEKWTRYVCNLFHGLVHASFRHGFARIQKLFSIIIIWSVDSAAVEGLLVLLYLLLCLSVVFIEEFLERFGDLASELNFTKKRIAI